LLGPIDRVGLKIVKAIDQEAEDQQEGGGPYGQVCTGISKSTLPRVARFKDEKGREVLADEEQ
jgi:hypothetical protein